MAPSKAGYVLATSGGDSINSLGSTLATTVQVTADSPWKDTLNFPEFQWRAVDVECRFAFKEDWNDGNQDGSACQESDSSAVRKCSQDPYVVTGE